MELTNQFRVGAPPDRAWQVLTDIERIAPCLPGAELQEVDGDQYKGVVKVKVGPITAQYKGTARLLERDESARRAVLRAEGRETRGQGNANASITAVLEPDGDGTRVSLTTDLAISGRVAQFGRGVLADVSGKLLDQFVQCLERDLLAAPAGPAAPATEARIEEAERVVGPDVEDHGVTARPVEPVNLVSTAGGAVAKRVVPVVLAALFVASWLLRRRKKG